jgi:hypothetical protein
MDVTVATQCGDRPMTPTCGRPRSPGPFGGHLNGSESVDERPFTPWSCGSAPLVPRKGPLTGA